MVCCFVPWPRRWFFFLPEVRASHLGMPENEARGDESFGTALVSSALQILLEQHFTVDLGWLGYAPEERWKQVREPEMCQMCKLRRLYWDFDAVNFQVNSSGLFPVLELIGSNPWKFGSVVTSTAVLNDASKRPVYVNICQYHFTTTRALATIACIVGYCRCIFSCPSPWNNCVSGELPETCWTEARNLKESQSFLKEAHVQAPDFTSKPGSYGRC